MSIIEKALKYEETELSVIKCKDDIWFRGKTIAEILGSSNPLKLFTCMLTLKTRRKYRNWNPNQGVPKMAPL